MLTWLSNLLSGRSRHWYDNSTTLVEALRDQAQEYPPAIALLLGEFVTQSNGITYCLLWPRKGRIVKKDILTVTAEQFRSLHHLNIWTLMATFGYLNPKLQDSMFGACKDFIEIQSNEQRMVMLVLQMKEFDLVTICQGYFDEVCNVLNYEPVGMLDWAVLPGILTFAFQEAMKKTTGSLRELG